MVNPPGPSGWASSWCSPWYSPGPGRSEYPPGPTLVRSSTTVVLTPKEKEGADSRVSSLALAALGYAPGPGFSAAFSRSPYAPSFDPRTPMVKLGPLGGLDPSPSYSPGPISFEAWSWFLVLEAIVNAGADGSGFELDPRTSYRPTPGTSACSSPHPLPTHASLPSTEKPLFPSPNFEPGCIGAPYSPGAGKSFFPSFVSIRGPSVYALPPGDSGVWYRPGPGIEALSLRSTPATTPSFGRPGIV